MKWEPLRKRGRDRDVFYVLRALLHVSDLTVFLQPPGVTVGCDDLGDSFFLQIVKQPETT